MRALIVYESMFGNTHLIADRIGEGLAPAFEVDVRTVADAAGVDVFGVDMLVVGGPTHMHGMSNARSRESARETAEEDDTLDLDVAAEGPGLRQWLDDLERGQDTAAAAFDTRVHGPALLTGRAAKGIARRLEHHGFTLIADPESFLVDSDSRLLEGQDDRALHWGAELARIHTAEMA